MSTQSVPRFLSQLKTVSLSDVFNPYSDRCSLYDRYNAPLLRCKILRLILQQAVTTEVDALWLARDLGYRGGRRTGLALTDDAHLNTHAARWKLHAQRSTKGTLIKEQTAHVVWKLLAQIPDNVFLWNVFPFHPHAPDLPLSNRSHTAAERDLGMQILHDLILLIQPRHIIAIGQDARKCALQVFTDERVIGVRHPSYGGQSEFLRTLSSHYGLPLAAKSLRDRTSATANEPNYT